MLKESLASVIASVLLLDGPLTEREKEINTLEIEIRQNLDAVPFDSPFNASFVANNGRKFSYSVGDITTTTLIESASTSKWVTASIILLSIQNNVLSLSDHPQQYIDFWPTTGELSEITLQQLMSFTSGLNNSPDCLNFGFSRFENCIETILEENQNTSLTPGSKFYYGSSHMQVAGLMTINALGLNSWQEVFEQFTLDTSLFLNSSYSLPSSQNPRLAGGMKWTTNDYLEFLKQLYKKELLNDVQLEQQRFDHIANSSIINSPALSTIMQDWRYGLGVWLECNSSVYNCNSVTRISSPGTYGAYPFIDYEHQYYGMIARQGGPSTFDEGYAIWQSVRTQLERWAALNE